MEKPLEACQHPSDILRIGNILENACNYEGANRLYGDYLDFNPENTKKRDLLIRMALNYKRLNNWREAEFKWLECVESQSYHPVPYIELAKHYEHRKRNLSKAKYYVEKALGNFAVLEPLNRNGYWVDYKQDLTYRLARLVRKLQK